jgi:hypothetical protein
MLFTETTAVYYENHTDHTNVLYGKNARFYSMTEQVVNMITTWI